MKLLIVDDHTVVLDGLESSLSDLEGLEKIYRSNSRSDMLHVLTKEFIDVILLDINMHGDNMLDYIDEVRRYSPTAKIIIFTSYDSQNLISEAIEKKVNAYLTKDTPREELMYAIQEVAQGRFYLSSNELDSEGKFKPHDDFELKYKLSKRELDVLRLLAKGYTNSRISKELNISIHTIQSHRKNMFKKLDVNSINQLISFAFRNGLV